MTESNNLTFARLLDWLEGRLSKEEEVALARQIDQADETVHADLAWLRSFLQISEETVLATPPPAVREQLRDRFEAFAQGRRQPGLLQRVLAALTFDSHLQLATSSLRATSTQASVRQVIYSTDMADIALNIQPRRQDQGLNISGQIFPKGEAAIEICSVQLLHGTTEIGLTVSDDLGEFIIEAVPVGVYDLILSMDQVEISITAVELKL